MPEDEVRACVLRTLTICDGEVAATAGPRALPTGCYCVRLDLAGEDRDRRRQVLHELARCVARADTIRRAVERRRQLDDW